MEIRTPVSGAAISAKARLHTWHARAGRNGTQVRVEYHSSIVLLRPVSAKAQSWCDEHMDPDALTFSDAYVVAPGYIGGILLGIEKAGLSVFDTSKFSERQQAAERCIELLSEQPDFIDRPEVRHALEQVAEVIRSEFDLDHDQIAEYKLTPPG